MQTYKFSLYYMCLFCIQSSLFGSNYSMRFCESLVINYKLTFMILYYNASLKWKENPLFILDSESTEEYVGSTMIYLFIYLCIYVHNCLGKTWKVKIFVNRSFSYNICSILCYIMLYISYFFIKVILMTLPVIFLSLTKYSYNTLTYYYILIKKTVVKDGKY